MLATGYLKILLNYRDFNNFKIMFRPRIIPVLLFKNNGLVKSKIFKDYRYIGDPINAVRIFNDLKADELIFLDIFASAEKRLVSLDFVRNIGEEANMPFGVGGGIKTIEDIRKIIGAGAEKVIINSYAAENPDFIHEASETFGSSTIVVCIDVKKNFWGRELTWTMNGKKSTGYSPVEFAGMMQKKGAGEIIIQSIERDGMMNGYDLDLVKRISEAVTIPVVALGGAGNIEHLVDGYRQGFANGLAAGSMFVYQGPKQGVLINYPEKNEVIFRR
jgi:cyclase